MALINCPECAKEVSDSAKKCLHCGYRLKPPFNWIPLVTISALVTVVALIFTYQKWKQDMERWEVNMNAKRAHTELQSAFRDLRPGSLQYNTDYTESKRDLKDLEDSKPRWLFW
jgi:predicted amidophosphoribosyltransferase